jgi:hypothetical protein
MVNQYFRWRCELLDNRPIQGEFSEDNWKWWKIWDGWVCDINNSWQWWNKNVKNL